jgi:type I restriction enzyme R subunit
LYSPSGAGYDRLRALLPEDVFAWLEQTQPVEWAKIVKPSMSVPEQVKAKDQLLDRLVKTLDLPIDAGGGILNALRKGFKKTPAKFSMCEFRPNTALNAAAMARYEAVRVRVMRQEYYSSKNSNSIDLVLFVNGLPVATLELKTDNIQSIDDAIAQYRVDRDQKGEPLLGFANRCLVHFAVSNNEVAMTTRLQGRATHFLPLNLGNEGAGGNPVNPGGAATSYLWEQVLQRDAWLHILGKLLHIETRTDIDPISGEATKKTTLLFPRYHQWELVTMLLDTVRAEGPGTGIWRCTRPGRARPTRSPGPPMVWPPCTTRTTARCSTPSSWSPTGPFSTTSCRRPSRGAIFLQAVACRRELHRRSTRNEGRQLAHEVTQRCAVTEA